MKSSGGNHENHPSRLGGYGRDLARPIGERYHIVANTDPVVAGVLSLTSPTFLRAAQLISPSAATAITSVDLFLAKNNTIGSRQAVLELHGDNSGAPGALVAALGTQSVANIFGASFTFTPAGPVSMAAATPYWLVLICADCVEGNSTTVARDLKWTASAGNTLAGLPGASLPLGVSTSVDGGSTWSLGLTGLGLQLAVNGNVASAPEPATLSLLGFGLLGGLALRAKSGRV